MPRLCCSLSSELSYCKTYWKIPCQAKIIPYRTLLSQVLMHRLLFDRPNNRNKNEHAATRLCVGYTL